MGDTTDRLLQLPLEMNPEPSSRALDVLLTAGDRDGDSHVGGPGVLVLGPASRCDHDLGPREAQIIDARPERVRRALARGAIVLVAGFQVLSRETEEITALGRGGSDTTAIALAAALKADVPRCGGP
ncbi:amino acid kinase family protein [Streptomyces antimycoticus]|uniref:amino acid kinase family protein n=1 Tax=Streptomyces antimycoticus TaxID=68175 RepID=UPI0033E192B4